VRGSQLTSSPGFPGRFSGDRRLRWSCQRGGALAPSWHHAGH
jgi:hypothetical protein